jgi:hypothetical protein
MNGPRWPKRASVAAAFSFIVLAALIGGAGTGGAAATTLEVTLVGQMASISSGRSVGYEATVENIGASTVTQVAFVLETGVGTYRASAVTAGLANCGQGQTASSLRCTTSQLAPFEKFTVKVAFTAPATASGSSITATGKATVSAQTEGAPGNKGTSSWFADPVTTTVLAPSDQSVSSFSLPGDALATGTSLGVNVQLPPAFLNGHFGLVTAASVFSGDPLCDKCPTVFAGLSIPASLVELTNPFSASSSYSMTLNLGPDAQPPGYKFAGISLLGDEEGAEWEPVPLCTSPTDVVPGPICLDGLPSKNKKTGVITGTLRGFENGSIGYD